MDVGCGAESGLELTWTHSNEIRLSLGPEVPFHGGRAFHLAPSLAGDAAQFEAPPCYRLRVGVHLRTGPMTLVHCSREEEKNTQTDNQYAGLARRTDTKRQRGKTNQSVWAVQDFPQRIFSTIIIIIVAVSLLSPEAFSLQRNIWCTRVNIKTIEPFCDFTPWFEMFVSFSFVSLSETTSSGPTMQAACC